MRTLTARELYEDPEHWHGYELVRGELRTLTPAGGSHGRVAMNLGWRLAAHVQEKKLGRVYAAETGFFVERSPDTVLAPDLAFVRRGRIRETDGFLDGPPDLAVEVRSPSHSRRNGAAKARHWLAVGCRLVWNVDIRDSTVTAFRAGEDPATLRPGDMLLGDQVVEGFAIAIDDIFAAD